MAPRHILALFPVLACQPLPVAQDGFGSAPELTTTESPFSSTSASGEASTGTSTGGTTTGLDISTGEAPASTSEPFRDLGAMPDFGDPPPAGCQGKIDFLFVISRQATMRYRQEQLTAAFPQFIDKIKSKFADFDYHIMVIDGDNEWGNSVCNEVCPDLSCEVGQACCPVHDAALKGELCCGGYDYPCDQLDLVTKCDTSWGAGTVFPAGNYAPNKPCEIDGGLRYLTKGQTNLEDTFKCIATIGTDGYDKAGQALVAAVQKPINDPGGCNRGFLRKDALLMVTFISASTDPEGWSDGTPAKWAEAVINAKHGDERSVVMLSLFLSEAQWKPTDRIGTLVKMFSYHHLEDSKVADYGPAFTTATKLVDTACAGFIPPS